MAQSRAYLVSVEYLLLVGEQMKKEEIMKKKELGQISMLWIAAIL
jgi:hypothetical protein